MAVLALTAPAVAQESQFQADLRREGEQIKESCNELNVKALGGCIVTLATADPFHIAAGSLPPQNGIGLGLAFVEHYTPNERWRISWNADAVNAFSGAWRAGAYLKIVHIPDEPPIGVRPAGGGSPANRVTIREYPVFNAYAQTISLDKLLFFGPGPGSVASGKSVYGERQTILGTSAIVPLSMASMAPSIDALRPSFVGAINGRFVDVRSNTSEDVPSTDAVYDDRSAPGLSQQPNFLQLEEGIRLKPSLLDDWLRLNYLVDFQQFLANEASHSSFHRWTLDLRHDIPLYRNVSSTGPKDTNGPDECFQAVGSNTCPPISTSRNRQGTATLRFFTSSSSAGDGNSVPFYFQPTLGGSDLNGQRILAAFDDYRFRGPKAMAFQESVEHSIWGPFGVQVLAEQAKISDASGDFGASSSINSFALGLTVRAGGFPVMSFSMAWGGGQRHFIGTMDSSLLGGSSRPSLY